MNKICVKSIVKGKVQGVWYRESTKKIAETLNLKGYAHNLRDGTVEVVTAGPADDIEKLLEWMEEGPSEANVTMIESTDMTFKNFNDFSIG